jgi:hypothetical protein
MSYFCAVMKALLSLTLFFALLLKMGGYYAILSIERAEIREKVEQKIIKSLPKSKLICIAANAENFSKISWERPEKEFSFEGNLYDIVFAENVDGTNYYYCLSDKAETEIEAKLNQWLDNQTEHLPFSTNSKHILQLLSEPSTIHRNPSFLFYHFFSEISSIFPNLVAFHTSDFVSTLEQPPQYS